MRVRLFTCAESFIRDGENNRVSAINIFDDAFYPQFPAVVMRMSVMVILEKEGDEREDRECRLVFCLDDEELIGGPLLADFQGAELTRAILNLSGLLIPRPGTLTARLLEGDAELARYDMRINALQPVLDQ